MPPLYTVYKNGDPAQAEKHTRLNAHDLVNGAGYTWKPHQTDITPAVTSPYKPAKGVGSSPSEWAQEVLNSVGHDVERASGSRGPLIEADDEDIIDMSVGDVTIEASADELLEPEIVPDADELLEPEIDEPAAEEAAPRRRGRPKASA
jgi:hypothetical protein